MKKLPILLLLLLAVVGTAILWLVEKNKNGGNPLAAFVGSGGGYTSPQSSANLITNARAAGWRDAMDYNAGVAYYAAPETADEKALNDYIYGTG